MNGWRYEWVHSLPIDVYQVLVEEIRSASEQKED